MDIYSKYTDSLVSNHQFQGYTNNCGPFCTAILINTLKGADISGNAIAQIMNKPDLNRFPPLYKRVPNGATFPWGIVGTFADFQIRSSWRFFSSFTTLKEHLSGNNLIIVLTANWLRPSAHYRVLTAIKENELGFVDPAQPQNSITWQGKRLFLNGWFYSGHALILVPVIV